MPAASTDAVAGLLLAAGAGRRMGRPKALIDLDGAPAALTAVRRLEQAGVGERLVVLGAQAEEVRAVLREEPGLDVVVADDWAEGMGASLRAGLRALAAGTATAALVTLVDLPDVTTPVLRRVLSAWVRRGSAPEDLLRASYDGRPGHPVLIGRAHWEPLVSSVAGDVGARDYLAERRVHEVRCEDLASGRDVDRPEDLEVRE